MAIDINNFWSSRDNLKNKPSVELRTAKVIEHLMKSKGIALGIAIELLMKTDGLYIQIQKELKASYPDI